MKKVRVVTTETLQRIANCFSDHGEVVSFITNLEEVVDDINLCVIHRKRSNSTKGSKLILEEICRMAIFCREYVELIRDLIRNIDLQEMDEDEIKNHKLQNIEEDND